MIYLPYKVGIFFMKHNKMALKKINLKNNTYRRTISIFLSCVIVLLALLITPSINIFGNKGGSKVLAYVYDGESHEAPPAKDSGYVIDEVRCTNAKGAWNNDSWEIVVYEIEGNFTCNLKFKLLHPYHSLIIDPNGGTYEDSPGPQEYNIQETYTFDVFDPTRKGHTFEGWEVTGRQSKIEDKIFTMGREDSTLTAKWQINDYDYITYHMQQGIGGEYLLKDVDTASAPYNSEVSPEVRTYTGFTSPSRKTIIITVEDNEINYQYTRNKYNLTITPGTGVTYNGTTSMSLYFEETTELDIPIKTGYNFKGWNYTSGTVTDNILKWVQIMQH